MALLTVDLGNTSTKLRLWVDGALARSAETPTGEGLEGELVRFLDGAPSGTRAALCSVACAELEGRAAQALRSRLGEGFLGVPESGVEVACRDARAVGRDRLFAARGALERLGQSALVVDAGTALTVDAVEHVPGAPARFLGGAIAPGPALMAGALASGAARLPRVDPRPGVPALGLDTVSAIEAGVVVGFRGAAGELVRRVGEESGLTAARVVLTGGARALLLEPPFISGRPLEELPDLVHLGLLAAAG